MTSMACYSFSWKQEPEPFPGHSRDSSTRRLISLKGFEDWRVQAKTTCETFLRPSGIEMQHFRVCYPSLTVTLSEGRLLAIRKTGPWTILIFISALMGIISAICRASLAFL